MNARVTMLAAIAAWAVLPLSARAAEQKEPGFTLTVGARETYDENLYRLADNLDPAAALGSGASRSDYISRVSLGLEQRWQWSRQEVLIDVKGNHDLYRYNDRLDNDSGAARAKWLWQAGERWAGELGGDYTRTLANFANTQYLGLDMVDTGGVSWTLAFRLGAQWSLRAAGRRAETAHSAPERRFDDSGTDSASVGLQFKTEAGNEFALSYRGTRATFESLGSLGGQTFDRDFDENSGSFRVHYVWSEKTTFDGSVGYLEREYSHAALAGDPRGSFGGSVWDAALQWEPSIKVRVELNGWRKLRAYLDAESDYFVANGTSGSLSWHPTDRIAIELGAEYETQDYLGSVSALTPERRRDVVLSETLTLSYRALRKLHFDLTGRLEDRDSNRPTLRYDAQVASIGVRWVY
jgi:hypothetical protein